MKSRLNPARIKTSGPLTYTFIYIYRLFAVEEAVRKQFYSTPSCGFGDKYCDSLLEKLSDCNFYSIYTVWCLLHISHSLWPGISTLQSEYMSSVKTINLCGAELLALFLDNPRFAIVHCHFILFIQYVYIHSFILLKGQWNLTEQLEGEKRRETILMTQCLH